MVAMLASQHFDWVMIDMEHSPLGPEKMTHMVHSVVAASEGQCLPVVRVPSHDVEWIKWALDSGAAGVVIPMVSNAAEMKRILDHAIYPPGGRRSFGPFNAPFGQRLHAATGFGEYYDHARAGGVVVLPIIESAEGVKNAEEILELEGVSGSFIGPHDLRLSMGLPGGLDGSEPEFGEALQRVCDAGKKYSKMIGSMGVGADVAKKRADMGMTFLLTTVDYSVLVAGFAAAKKEIEQAFRAPRAMLA
jgi:2-keto-3-deoxy-L-rhamnonate aldolase RhmA